MLWMVSVHLLSENHTQTIQMGLSERPDYRRRGLVLPRSRKANHATSGFAPRPAPNQKTSEQQRVAEVLLGADWCGVS